MGATLTIPADGDRKGEPASCKYVDGAGKSIVSTNVYKTTAEERFATFTRPELRPTPVPGLGEKSSFSGGRAGGLLVSKSGTLLVITFDYEMPDPQRLDLMKQLRTLAAARM